MNNPTQNIDYQNAPEDTIVISMRTDLLSHLVDTHVKNIGALRPNEEYHVVEVNVDGDITIIEGFIEEESVN